MQAFVQAGCAGSRRATSSAGLSRACSTKPAEARAGMDALAAHVRALLDLLPNAMIVSLAGTMPTTSPICSSVHRANQHKFVMNLPAKHAWPLRAATWSPSSQHNFNSVPRRRPCRPPKRWDDELNKFVMSQFPGCSSWSDKAHLPRWPSTRHDFVQFDRASQIN